MFKLSFVSGEIGMRFTHTEFFTARITQSLPFSGTTNGVTEEGMVMGAEVSASLTVSHPFPRLEFEVPPSEELSESTTAPNLDHP